ncbi:MULTISPECIES: hypothetical protein [Streptomyces]|uniref:hypothetical protein n=1 Tax=Streptomyces TaxID=1883 RepID=UPI0004BD23A8|nr:MULTISPECIES: hypothetical protein [Streptomyces]NEB59478.1 MbtH domain protein [Streptomyces diastaticus]KOU01075.1 hypothetical protein ADK87_12040 [Streptomyces sp. NRRL F-4711]KOX34000.1 hypothetical protein ADL07_08460 [Streptomyces sp. NRRL F-4707]KOX50079.1 hypothetical protein ADL09_07265 [Streptomyces sp. NRRL F-7442]MCL7368521.1 hypothetical protein [Streptomyces ardesiacus]
MDELLRRLSAEGQKTAAGGPSPSVEDLRRRVAEKGYVFIKFTDTAGGTDLGVRVDADACDLSGADFARGIGSVHIEGTLTLNLVKVRCVTDIELSSLTGTGHLVPVEEAVAAR